MSRILKRILLFSLGFLLINTLLSWVFIVYIAENYQLSKDDKIAWTKMPKASVLLIGDSRAKQAVSDDLAYLVKMCSNGETIIQSYARFKKAIAVNKNVKIVLLSIDQTYTSRVKPGNEQQVYFWSKYLSYSLLASKTGDYKDYYYIAGKNEFFPYHQYPKNKLENFNHTYLLKQEIKDYPKQTNQERNQTAQKVARIQKESRYLDDKTALKCYKSIIDICHQKGIKLVLVAFPVSREYLNQYHFINDVNKLKLLNYIKNKNISYLNFENMFDRQPQYFKDVSHLNEKGQQVFSDSLFEVLSLK